MSSLQGWEEIVDAAVTHLLRTTLAKSQKDQQQTSFQSLELPADSHKLKKHIALLCDRITKGYLPTGKKVEVIPHSFFLKSYYSVLL